MPSSSHVRTARGVRRRDRQQIRCNRGQPAASGQPGAGIIDGASRPDPRCPLSRVPQDSPTGERLTRDALVAAFHGYGAQRAHWLVGGEFERQVLRRDGSPVGYSEPQGIRWILEQLVQRYGWSPIEEGGHVIELHRGKASITLEPGGQVELSGAPFPSVAEVEAEAHANLLELNDICNDGGLLTAALGLSPYAAVADIPYVPKGRYAIMRDYLPPRGDLSEAMMKATTSFQANFDFADEADCARKVDLLLGVAPLNTAMFANSPVFEGQDTGWASYRGHVWTRTDPDRCGFPAAVREGYTHERWVDYLLDVPMMFYRAAGQWHPAHGRTFRSYMEQGIAGVFPSWGEWQLHQTSVFPEVRVKRTVEVRGCDAVPLPLAVAGIAMWTGLLYCEAAWDQGTQLARELSATGTREERFAEAARHGLRGMWGGRTFAAWSSDLVAVARAGLSRCSPHDVSRLAPLEALIAGGESPADAVRLAWQADPRPDAFLPRHAYRA